MTRKDYVAIAECFNLSITSLENSRCVETAGSALAFVADAIAERMANDNPRFDRARFLKACGVQS